MKYQIKILGTPWRLDELESVMKDYPSFVFLSKEDELDTSYPYLCLYYGNSETDANIEREYEDLLNYYLRKRTIQPVGREAADFKTKFPSMLKSLNGFFLDDTVYTLQSLKNLLLSYFGILEGTRKVFISYHRDETEELAHKLFDLLVRKKYHPFLDAYSIESGVDFQEYLRHELMSSDIVVLLDTPGFNSSDYCMEEFNISNAENIPILDVRFKIDPKKNHHRFCDYIETGLSSEDGNKDQELPCKIMELMEQSRAKAFCIKRKFILDELKFRCEQFGLDIIEQGGFLRCDTTHECFYPLTHIPSSENLYRVKKTIEKTPLFTTYAKQVLYNGNYCRPDINAQLSWWNEYLPVKIYNITK